MADFIDYYEQLGLNRNDPVADVQMELNKLESIWKRREISNPEKAATTLELVREAKKIFQDENGKEEYDRALDESRQTPVEEDAEAERRERLNHWLGEAQRYYEEGQIDLAREAINSASRFVNMDDNDSYYFLLARISFEDGDVKVSLSAINRAIVINPNIIVYYFFRAALYNCLFRSLPDDPATLDESLDYLEKEREALKKAATLSEACGDNDQRINALSLLAYSYSKTYNQDLDEAERLAKKVISLGDKSGDMEALLQEIKEERESFQPYQGSNHPSVTTGGKCYIATAVYGSYDCPEVWTLRRFRDQKLLSTWRGRIFVRIYYATSPTLVRLFGSRRWFNSFWRKRLDQMVDHLREEGISDTPYFDECVKNTRTI